jgi:signal transduction histidine kinase
MIVVADTSAAPQRTLASPEERDQWVQIRLVGLLMKQARPAMLSATFSMPFFVVLLLNEVPKLALFIWAGLLVSVMVYLYRRILLYQALYGDVLGAEYLAYLHRYRWTWMLVGALWGGGMGLAFPAGSSMVKFVCGLIVLGQGLLTLTTFSAYLPIFYRFINGFMGSLILGLLVAAYWYPGTGKDLQHVWIAALIFPFFWWLLRNSAIRLNRVQRASLELQFSNQELIDSLTQQTRALQRAVAAKNRFLASAGHDLRQPVHALSLYADWLQAEPEMAPEVAPRILQSTRAINELFDSLFDLTRIDAGNYKVRLQPVDVHQLLADLKTQFDPMASSKSLQLRVRVRPQPTTLWADPVMLRRILSNLLSNALKHTQQGGVLLAVRHRSDQLVFEVWDTGIGIAQEHQQSIFQEFFRVSQHQGTEDSLGLGLTIVSRLCSLMGYQLALTSHPGKGSVFRMRVPAYNPKDPAIVPD